MKLFRISLLFIASIIFFCSSMFSQQHPKVKVADGFVQVEKVHESKVTLEVTVYNATTEYVSGIVTIMKPTNLSSNQKVIKIAPGRTETVYFPKEDKDKIVTWEEVKLHSFSVSR